MRVPRTIGLATLICLIPSLSAKLTAQDVLVLPGPPGQLGAPGWLKEYAPTEYKIVTDAPIMASGQNGYLIYAKKVAPGKFTLGAPGLEVRHHSIYFAFFGEEK